MTLADRQRVIESLFDELTTSSFAEGCEERIARGTGGPNGHTTIGPCRRERNMDSVNLDRRGIRNDARKGIVGMPLGTPPTQTQEKWNIEEVAGGCWLRFGERRLLYSIHENERPQFEQIIELANASIDRLLAKQKEDSGKNPSRNN